MYGYRPAAHAYPQLPYAGTNGLVTHRTAGIGPMRGGPWPAPSTGLDMAGVKTWLDAPSLGVAHKWWVAGIGALAVGALAYHGHKKHWW